jgi:pimeloyl-ACP methyl ester carboxylesterase
VSKWIILIVLLLMVAGGVGAQEAATIALVPPPPGELVDVGGYRLHIYCVGEGSPTVILEPGFARFSLNMLELQRSLSSERRVCAYDHAGFGWSEAGTLPRTTQRLSDDLAALLENAGIEPPYLLVAHSMGGFVARTFAVQHAEDVAGVVLLDSTPPEFMLDPVIERANMMFYVVFQDVAQRVASTGTWDQMSFTLIRQQLDDVPTHLHEAYLALASQPTYFDALLSEWENRAENAQSVINAGGLGDTPLVVIVAGERLLLKTEADILWARTQVAQAALSTDTEMSISVSGSHSFYDALPELVARAVRRMIEGE